MFLLCVCYPPPQSSFFFSISCIQSKKSFIQSLIHSSNHSLIQSITHPSLYRLPYRMSKKSRPCCSAAPISRITVVVSVSSRPVWQRFVCLRDCMVACGQRALMRQGYCARNNVNGRGMYCYHKYPQKHDWLRAFQGSQSKYGIDT